MIDEVLVIIIRALAFVIWADLLLDIVRGRWNADYLQFSVVVAGMVVHYAFVTVGSVVPLGLVHADTIRILYTVSAVMGIIVGITIRLARD